MDKKKINYSVEEVRLILFAQCIFERDNYISIVPMSYIKYDKSSTDCIQPKHKLDFEPNHKYRVKWFECNSRGIKCDDPKCKHQFSEWSAKLHVLGETPMAVKRYAKDLRRIRFKPEKLKSSTSGSDVLADKTEEKCKDLVKVKKEVHDARLAAKQQQSQKQLEIWDKRFGTNHHTSLSVTQSLQRKSTAVSPLQTCPHINSIDSSGSRFYSTSGVSGQTVTSTNTSINASNTDALDDDGMAALNKMIEEQENDQKKSKSKTKKVVPETESNLHYTSSGSFDCTETTLSVNKQGKGVMRPKSTTEKNSSVAIRKIDVIDPQKDDDCTLRMDASRNLVIPSTSNYEYHTVGNERGTSSTLLQEASSGELDNDDPEDARENQNSPRPNGMSNEPNDYMKMLQRQMRGYEFDPATSVEARRPLKRKAALIVNAITMYKDKSRPEYAEAKKRYKMSSGMAHLGQGVKAHPVAISVLKSEKNPEKYLKAVVLHFYPLSILGNLSFEPEQVEEKFWIPGRSPPHQFEKKKLDLILSIYYDYLMQRFDDDHDFQRVHYMKKATKDISRWMRGQRFIMRKAASN
ncbi:hypothetical protein QAD02_016408 [Eretmocerus hayati]|uniref:Uncharacterized protein n=1 Tax=Eretmocerus hayati TaxID=131215 RepID=A0ACC2PCU4_9HYME|nr:hypothetical protein QAD02_016408 [Eretmocerus hayati]